MTNRGHSGELMHSPCVSEGRQREGGKRRVAKLCYQRPG